MGENRQFEHERYQMYNEISNNPREDFTKSIVTNFKLEHGNETTPCRNLSKMTSYSIIRGLDKIDEEHRSISPLKTSQFTKTNNPKHSPYKNIKNKENFNYILGQSNRKRSQTNLHDHSPKEMQRSLSGLKLKNNFNNISLDKSKHNDVNVRMQMNRIFGLDNLQD